MDEGYKHFSDTSWNLEGNDEDYNQTRGKKRKKCDPKMKFTSDQLQLLEQSFKDAIYPSKLQIQYLTRTTQLPPTLIRRWFNEKRSGQFILEPLERVHLVPKTVPDDSGPLGSKFKTVLVRIDSPEHTPTEETPTLSLDEPNRPLSTPLVNTGLPSTLTTTPLLDMPTFSSFTQNSTVQFPAMSSSNPSLSGVDQNIDAVAPEHMSVKRSNYDFRYETDELLDLLSASSDISVKSSGYQTSESFNRTPNLFPTSPNLPLVQNSQKCVSTCHKAPYLYSQDLSNLQPEVAAAALGQKNVESVGPISYPPQSPTHTKQNKFVKSKDYYGPTKVQININKSPGIVHNIPQIRKLFNKSKALENANSENSFNGSGLTATVSGTNVQVPVPPNHQIVPLGGQTGLPSGPTVPSGNQITNIRYVTLEELQSLGFNPDNLEDVPQMNTGHSGLPSNQNNIPHKETGHQSHKGVHSNQIGMHPNHKMVHTNLIETHPVQKGVQSNQIRMHPNQKMVQPNQIETHSSQKVAHLTQIGISYNQLGVRRDEISADPYRTGVHTNRIEPHLNQTVHHKRIKANSNSQELYPNKIEPHSCQHTDPVHAPRFTTNSNTLQTKAPAMTAQTHQEPTNPCARETRRRFDTTMEQHRHQNNASITYDNMGCRNESLQNIHMKQDEHIPGMTNGRNCQSNTSCQTGPGRSCCRSSCCSRQTRESSLIHNHCHHQPTNIIPSSLVPQIIPSLICLPVAYLLPVQTAQAIHVPTAGTCGVTTNLNHSCSCHIKHDCE